MLFMSYVLYAKHVSNGHLLESNIGKSRCIVGEGFGLGAIPVFLVSQPTLPVHDDNDTH